MRKDIMKTTVKNTMKVFLKTRTETFLIWCQKGSVWNRLQDKLFTVCLLNSLLNWRSLSTQAKRASVTPGGVLIMWKGKVGTTKVDSNRFIISTFEESELCPDDISFRKLVNVLKDTASSNSFLPSYKTGRMTDTVYSVKGGMEDWVYGVGWENQVSILFHY